MFGINTSLCLSVSNLSGNTMLLGVVFLFFAAVLDSSCGAKVPICVAANYSFEAQDCDSVSLYTTSFIIRTSKVADKEFPNLVEFSNYNVWSSNASEYYRSTPFHFPGHDWEPQNETTKNITFQDVNIGLTFSFTHKNFMAMDSDSWGIYFDNGGILSGGGVFFDEIHNCNGGYNGECLNLISNYQKDAT